MVFHATPPVPPTPPAIIRCTTADGRVLDDCAKYVYTRQNTNVEARFTGSVRIHPSSEAVVIVPPGGTASIEERAGKSVRRFSVENGKTTYSIDGATRPFDGAARLWLRDVLSTMPATPVPPSK
ncbi:MAG TPA: hypothetical protein VGF69_23145 [Thermoanaerobaculia bacterium]|jgi:hypothetical protein